MNAKGFFMIRNGIDAYRQLSDTMKQLARLQKRPVYDCGDGVYETVMTGAGPSDFEELRRERMKGGALLWDNTIAGNRFCGMSAGADDTQGYVSLAYLPGAQELRVAVNPTGAAMPDRLGDAPQHVGSVRLTQVCPDDSAVSSVVPLCCVYPFTCERLSSPAISDAPSSVVPALTSPPVVVAGISANCQFRYTAAPRISTSAAITICFFPKITLAFILMHSLDLRPRFPRRVLLHKPVTY